MDQPARRPSWKLGEFDFWHATSNLCERLSWSFGLAQRVCYLATVTVLSGMLGNRALLRAPFFGDALNASLQLAIVGDAARARFRNLLEFLARPVRDEQERHFLLLDKQGVRQTATKLEEVRASQEQHRRNHPYVSAGDRSEREIRELEDGLRPLLVFESVRPGQLCELLMEAHANSLCGLLEDLDLAALLKSRKGRDDFELMYRAWHGRSTQAGLRMGNLLLRPAVSSIWQLNPDTWSALTSSAVPSVVRFGSRLIAVPSSEVGGAGECMRENIASLQEDWEKLLHRVFRVRLSSPRSLELTQVASSLLRDYQSNCDKEEVQNSYGAALAAKLALLGHACGPRFGEPLPGEVMHQAIHNAEEFRASTREVFQRSTEDETDLSRRELDRLVDKLRNWKRKQPCTRHELQRSYHQISAAELATVIESAKDQGLLAETNGILRLLGAAA